VEEMMTGNLDRCGIYS